MSNDSNRPYRYRSFNGIDAHTIMIFVTVWSALTVCALRLSSTTVVALVTRQRITIGADAMSKVYGGKRIKVLRICKIYEAGSSFFAFAGMDQDDDTGFVASTLVDKRAMLNVRARAERFAREIKKPYLKTIQRFNKDNPRIKDAFRQRFSEHALQAIFVGSEAGIPVFNTVEVNVETNPLRIETVIHGCPGDFCPLAGQIKDIWLGHFDDGEREYQRMLATHNALLKDDAATVEHLIDTEIAAVPKSVGPPVAVLIIDNSGSHWFTEGKCGGVTEKTKRQSK